MILNNTNFGTETHVPTPPYGQYLTHAHNHINQAVAAIDSCFVLIRNGISMAYPDDMALGIQKSFPYRGVGIIWPSFFYSLPAS